MRKLVVLILWFFGSIALLGQTTTVTATITDSDSTVWINPQWGVQFVPNPNFPQLSSYSIGGVPITSNTYSQYIQVSGTGNSSGVISTTLLDNNQILPAGSKYRWVVQSQTSAAATTYLPVTVTGASQSLTSYLSTNSTAPRFAAITQAFGYADVEISMLPPPGGTYWNTTSVVQRIWNGIAWISSGGSGAISSVSNTDSTLVISPTTGAVIASLNLAHQNTWTAQQNFNAIVPTAIYLPNASNPSMNISSSIFLFNSVTGIAWTPTSAFDTQDTAVCRQAAGIVEIANGADCNSNGTVKATHYITGSAETTVAVTPTVGQTACIKAAGPPVVIGTCSSIVGAGGACTCN